MEAAQAHLSLHLSKCHIVGNHMTRVIYTRNKKEGHGGPGTFTCILSRGGSFNLLRILNSFEQYETGVS